MDASPAIKRRPPGRLYVALGILIPLFGIVLYTLQIAAQRLTVPWYAPLFGLMGVGLVLLAVIRAWSVWRILALLFVGLLTGFELYFLFGLSNLPAYAGPVKVGQPFPGFATTLSDGSPFDHNSLKGEQDTVMVFFRGHW